MERETIAQTGLTTSRVENRTAIRSWICRVVSGPEAGREAAIGARPLVIGAHGSCDLVLSDPKVSKRHVEVGGAEGGVRVRDLGSTNGTRWHSSRITDAVVPVGSAIEVGSTTIRFLAGPAPRLEPSGRRAFGGLVGRSVAIRELFAVLELASPTDATILIQGESGTGKEIAARAVHDHSRRASGPFVVVDCTSITEQLAESQLFGHRRGAFTGAVGDRRGAFAEASGGTLFLDELGELPLAIQAKLLRALEQQVVTPVGSDEPVRVDTRVVAATHRDLFAMVEAKQFRFDLFHRLAVVHVAMPPLREHVEDLPELIEHFYAGRGVRPGEIAGPNLVALQQHSWPGNVRELRNVLDRAWALSGGGGEFASLRLWLHPGADAPAAEMVDTHLPFKDAKERWVERFERRYLAAVYAAHDHNITHAADHAGINRRHFRELLKKYDLHRSRDDADGD